MCAPSNQQPWAGNSRSSVDNSMTLTVAADCYVVDVFVKRFVIQTTYLRYFSNDIFFINEF